MTKPTNGSSTFIRQNDGAIYSVNINYRGPKVAIANILFDLGAADSEIQREKVHDILPPFTSEVIT